MSSVREGWYYCGGKVLNEIVVVEKKLIVLNLAS
jgi:hypothetical protein